MWLLWTPIVCCFPRVTLSAAPPCLSRTSETSLSSHSRGMPFLSLCTGVKHCPSPGPAAAPPRNQGSLALPPHCWSVHNYSPGPCHHTPVVHSQIQELSVYPAKDRDFSEFLMVVLKKVDFLLCMGVQPINHVVVVYSALLFDCRLLGQCI